MRQAALVLAVFDGSRPLTGEDKALAAEAAGANAIAVVNKADRPVTADVGYLQGLFDRVVTLSAKDGAGVDELTRAVAAITGVQGLTGAEPVLATERQRAAAGRCRDSLQEALAALEAGMTLDAVTVSVEDAIAAVLELTGERTTEAVVDEVFARFCVGK